MTALNCFRRIQPINLPILLVIVCLVDLNSGSIQARQVVECPPLFDPDNGAVTEPRFPDPSLPGDVASFTCNEDYILKGSEFLICQTDGNWDDNDPTCNRVCPGLPNPPNGTVLELANPSSAGDDAIYSCNEYYQLQGTFFRTCQDDGTWDDVEPVCARECEFLLDPINGNVDEPNFPSSAGHTATYSCSPPFALVGGIVRTCQEDGSWDGQDRSCILAHCPVPEDPDNGRVIIPPGDIVIGTIVTFYCEESYSLKGSRTRTCQDNGTWTGDEPTCPRECLDLYNPTNGQVVVSNTPTTSGDTATYTCDTNYVLVGDTTRTCLMDGTWTSQEPTCLRECTGLANPDNGNVIVPNSPSRSGDTATYSCDSGYALVGDSTRTCGDDGLWSNTAPTCLRECTTLTAPLNGQVTSPNSPSRSGDVATYSCNENYLLQGNQDRTCQNDGTFTGSQPTCARVCPDIMGTGLTVTSSTSPYIEGNTVSLSCTSPYSINGVTTLTCENTGSWSETIPTCRIECSTLSSPANGNITKSNPSLIGDIAVYSCSENYSLIGLSQKTCQSDGKWSGTSPTCARECPLLLTPSNGQVIFESYPSTEGQIAGYSCNTNYIIQGFTSRICLNSGIWTGEAPTCVRKCSDLTNPTNGQVTTPNDPSLAGDTATYSCLTNYSLVGNVNRTCLETGEWSGEPPACMRECSSLTAPSNGQVTSPNNLSRNGDLVSYSCDENYLLQGNQNRTCQSNGTFTGNQPTCARVCPDITGTGLTVTGSTSPYIEGNTLSLSCTSPYTINGVTTLTCENTGSWSETIPTCRIECSSLSSPTNGDITLNSPSLIGDIAVYSCLENYSLIGPAQRTCQTDGQWSGIPPICARECPLLLTPCNGQVTVESCPSTVGQLANYTCNTNYNLQGNITRVCQDNGTWSGVEPSCIRECPGLTNPANGQVTTQNDPSLTGDEATYSCVTNYSLVGNVNRTCLETGVWSGEPPACLRECSTLPTPTNGQVTSPNNPSQSGDVVTYSCNENYNLQGNQNRTCQSNGTFTGSQPTCARVCPDISGTALVVTGSTSYIEGIVVTLSCTSPYTINGSSTLTCEPTGSWSQDIPTCHLECSTLSNPSNGNIILNNPSVIGDIAVYSCSENFSLIGLAQRTCQSDGQWSGTPPTCARECATLLTPSNGQISVESCPSTEGQLANYTCNINYTLQGNITRVCQDNGTWSGEAPSCVRECPGLKNLTNGQVTTPNDPNLAGDEATYSCVTNYSLVGNVNRTCLETGVWSGEPPACLIECSTVPSPTNGQVTSQNNPSRSGDVVSYSCNENYVLQGNQNRTCQNNGTFTGSQPTCARVCPDISGTALVVTGPTSPYTAGNVVSLSCTTPYTMNGSSILTCEITGSWSEDVPVCSIGCSNLSSPANGNFTLNNPSLVGDIAVYSCSENYSLIGLSQRTCQSDGQWSGTPPTCVRECPSLLTPSNGQVTVESCPSTEGQLANYTCNTNYTLQGIKIQVCQDDGIWSGEAPSCVRECPGLTNPTNGQVTTSNDPSLAGDEATYSCQTNYSLVGNANRTCLETGVWSGEPPACLRACTTLSAPSNGQVTSPNTPSQSGDIVSYSCNENYLLQGNLNRTCQSNGTFTGSQPSCVRVCSDITGTGLTVTGSTSPYIEGNAVSLSCTSPYTINGSTILICENTGSWSETIPTCNIECSSLSNPSNGNIMLNNPSTIGDIAVYSCPENYSLIGLAQRTCQSDGQWSGRPPTCAIECPLLLTPCNGQVTVESYPSTVGQLANYTCSTNYTLQGNITRVCQDNGTWSGVEPSCIRECPGLTSPSNGQVTTPNDPSLPGDIAKYSCLTNYNLVGNVNRTCLETGVWSGEPPSCLGGCGDVNGTALIVNGSGSPYQEGAVIQLSCETPYTLNGPTILTCLTTGSWNNTPPTCRIECQNLASPLNGQVTTSNNPSLVGDTAIYTCNLNYSLQGTLQRTCGGNAQWTGTAPTCVRECSSLSNIANGSVTTVKSPSIIGDNATYSCDAGFVLIGNGTRTCQESGEWTGQIPSCIRECSDLSDPVNGNVTTPGTPSTAGHIATYMCDENYMLIGVENRTCLENGSWNGVTPNCSRVCSNITGSNLVVDGSKSMYTAGDQVSLSCMNPYTLNGVTSLTCESNGSWNNDIPNCRIECSELQSPSNGQVVLPLSRTVGQIANYSCDSNYRLVGNELRTCGSDGEWDLMEPSCLRICNITGTALVVNGPTLLTYVEGNVVNLTCEHPYTLNGVSNLTCLANGSWDSVFPTCKIECERLSDPLHGQVIQQYIPSTVGQMATYVCDNNYYLNGTEIRSCQANGQWTGIAPTCVQVCPTISKTHMTVNGSKSTYMEGDQVVLSCVAPYNLTGVTSLTCLSNGSWSENIPTCQIDCGSLSDLSNGQIMFLNNESSVGQAAIHTCDDNYFLKGDSVRVCLQDGNWSSDPPSCNRECPTLPNPQNGQVIEVHTKGVTGQVATYTCNDNYTLVGDCTRMCLENGSWTGAQPSCSRECSAIFAPQHGQVITSSEQIIVGTTANYSCNENFILKGNESRICQDDGQWTGATPSCVRECPMLSHPSNGSVTTVNIQSVAGDLANYTCNENYILQGDSTRLCQIDGQWSSVAPTCARECTILLNPLNGQVSTQSVPSTVGDSASYRCSQNYTLQGNFTRVCQDDGQWNGMVPTCIQECPILSNPANGQVRTPRLPNLVGDIANYTCNENYILQGNITRLCQDDGLWDGMVPTCIRECGSLSDPINGQVTASDFPVIVGDVATYTCNENFTLQGNPTQTCQNDGLWSGLVPSCVRECPVLSSPENGKILVPSVPSTAGDVAFYMCNVNFVLLGETMRTCLDSGKWTGLNPSCVQGCPILMNPANGNVVMSGNGTSVLGDIATYMCDKNFILDSNQTLRCQENGTWSGDVPRCLAVCPDLPNPVNGTVTSSDGTSTVGHVAVYMCNENLILSGNNIRTCLENGSWSGQPPMCVTDSECPDLPAIQNGEVSTNITNTLGDIVTYLCNDGYFLQGDPIRTCIESGTWSGIVPSCVRVCPLLNDPVNGEITGQFTPRTVGQVVTYSCNINHILQGDSLRTCLDTGQWSGQEAVCNKVCPDLTSPLNGELSTKAGPNTVGQVVNYTCNTNYVLQGNASRTCLDNGQWSGLEVECVLVPIPICVSSQVTGDVMNGTDEEIINTFNSTYFGDSSQLAGLPIQSMILTRNAANTTLSVCLEITSMNSLLITNIGNGFTLLTEDGRNNTYVTTIGNPELVVVNQNYSVVIDTRCFWYKYMNTCVDMGLCEQRGDRILCKCEETACYTFSDGIIPYLIPPILFFVLTMLWCGACRSYCGRRMPSRIVAASQSGAEVSVVSEERPFIFPRYRADGLMETKTTFTQVPLETSQSMAQMSSMHEEVVEKSSVAMAAEARSMAQGSSMVEEVVDEGSVSIVTSSRPMTQVSAIYEEILDSGSLSVVEESRSMAQVSAVQEELISGHSATEFAAFRPMSHTSTIYDEFASEGSMSIISSARPMTQISTIPDEMAMDSSVSMIASSRPMAQMSAVHEGYAVEGSIAMGSSVSQEMVQGVNYVEDYPVETVIGSSCGTVQDMVEVQQYQSAPMFGNGVILNPTNFVEEDPYFPYM